MIEFEETLKNSDFEKRLNNLSKKYKNKKVVLYGAGSFFEHLKNNYDLKKLNVIAVSDKKFAKAQDPEYCENIGYNTICAEKIHTLKPDIVLITCLVDFYIEKYFVEELFKLTKQRFKYDPIFKLSWHQKIQKAWNEF